MKKSLLFLLAVFCTLVNNAQENEGGTIVLEITNIENSKGKLMIGLYQDESNWLKKPFKGKIGIIEEGKCIAVFEDIPLGNYAISVFHDEDNDGKLDTILGIPTEDTGSSNNAPARFGPPKWQDARFKLNGESIKHTIKL